MIEVKNITKQYGSHLAVNDLSFSIKEGKVYGLLGRNGAGKSTTMNIMTGCLSATSGEVIIDGYDIFRDAQNAKKHIGYLPEQPPVYAEMTPYEYLRFVGSAKGLRGEELENQIYDAMDKTQTVDVRDRLIKNLSKGYRQRVGIAQAVIGDPQMVILDEPMVGLDPKQILEIRDLIRGLKKDRTVILSSHVLGEVAEVCDYIMIIDKGQLVAEGTVEELESRFAAESSLKLEVKGDMTAVKAVLDGLQMNVISLEQSAGGTVRCDVDTAGGIDMREQVALAFAEAKLPVLQMTLAKASLEDVFLELTSDDQITGGMQGHGKGIKTEEAEEKK